MATYYIDFAGGNDANAGTSFALRWKTITSGATAARIAAGDTIRIMATPDETLIGDATWTDLSKTVTLAAAVTANISDCETAWTGSANVTATADAAVYKQGSKSAKLVIAAAFTTGLVAYFPTGTLDLSGYQQVSFWVLNSAALAASTLSLRLCSDAAGVTTVHTIAIPAIPSAGLSHWVPITVNLGSNLSSAIASVALYADLDPGTTTINLDNIIACKASSAADSLTLTSLIGKVHNRSWTASTSYAANSIRRPTQPNRNGFSYKVTAGGGGNSGSTEPNWPQELGLTVTDGALTWTCNDLEETYYPLQSINGTTLRIDNSVTCNGNAGKGYSGTSETVASYKRDTVTSTMEGNFSLQTPANVVQKAGSANNLITFSGGWNRTDMSTQTGETWRDGQNGWGSGLYAASSLDYLAWENLNAVRFGYGLYFQPSGVGYRFELKNCHLVGNDDKAMNVGKCQNFAGRNLIGSNGNDDALFWLQSGGSASCVVASNNLSTGGSFGFSSTYPFDLNQANCKNNDHNGGPIYAIGNPLGNVLVRNLVTANNANVSSVSLGNVTFVNCLFNEASNFSALNDNLYVRSQRHNQIADNHLVVGAGGSIVSATDQRKTASGIAWKFRPSVANLRFVYQPLLLSVAKVAVNAATLVTVSIWTRRDNTNVQGQLRVRPGQLLGVMPGVLVACAPTINTWTQYSLTFTPTEAGVVDLEFLVWDGVGTTNAFWIDDLTVTQA